MKQIMQRVGRVLSIETVRSTQVSPMRGDGRGGGAVHLMRLSRGLTPATIQDVAFSACGTLLSVSSARGTTHIYRLALPGTPLPSLSFTHFNHHVAPLRRFGTEVEGRFCGYSGDKRTGR